MVMNSANSDESEEEATTSKTKKLAAAQKSWSQSRFSCMKKHTATDKEINPNARTIAILQQMSDYYDRTKDQWRTLAYRRALSALKTQPHRITTKEEAVAIPNIGDRLASKIEEIAFTDRLRRLENTNLDDRDTALQLFLKIYGVGPSQAFQVSQVSESLPSKFLFSKAQHILGAPALILRAARRQLKPNKVETEACSTKI